jgi:hypothetical protein
VLCGCEPAAASERIAGFSTTEYWSSKMNGADRLFAYTMLAATTIIAARHDVEIWRAPVLAAWCRAVRARRFCVLCSACGVLILVRFMSATP